MGNTGCVFHGIILCEMTALQLQQAEMTFDSDLGPLEIQVVSHSIARQACERWHYSGSCPSGGPYYGFYRGLMFDGVIAFREHNTNVVVRYWEGVAGGKCTELSRMALRPQAERPPTTQYLSLAMNAVRRLGVYEAVYSYADAMEGHAGTVYRAASFQYAGYSERESTAYIHPDGRRYAARNFLMNYPVEWQQQMMAEGTIAVSGKKHRYVRGLTRHARRRIARQASSLESYKTRFGTKKNWQNGNEVRT